MNRSLTLAACFLCLITGLSSAAPRKGDKNNIQPLGPTVFDAGINSDGYQTYIIHGYYSAAVPSPKGSGSHDILVDILPTFSPPLGLDVSNVLQGTLVVSGFGSGARPEIYNIKNINIMPYNGSNAQDHPVHIAALWTVRDIVGKGDIQVQFEYNVLLATNEKSSLVNTASQAAKDAATATANASNALNVANMANGTANTALSAANGAVSTANTAQATANDAAKATAMLKFFIKTGNDGEASCSQFCAGPNWPGGTGTCVASVMIKSPETAVTCETKPESASPPAGNPHELYCLCSSFYK